MPANVTLATTTLAQGLNASDNLVKLASTDGIIVGTRLFVEGELMKVNSLSISPWVMVRRGEMTAAMPHSNGATVYIGRADQFFSQDPVGAPDAIIQVSPYINVLNGNIWFAQGDASSTGTFNRYWQLQTTTHTAVPMGFRSSTIDPTSST